jgi:hypothetical protein
MELGAPLIVKLKVNGAFPLAPVKVTTGEVPPWQTELTSTLMVAVGWAFVLKAVRHINAPKKNSNFLK